MRLNPYRDPVLGAPCVAWPPISDGGPAPLGRPSPASRALPGRRECPRSPARLSTPYLPCLPHDRPPLSTHPMEDLPHVRSTPRRPGPGSTSHWPTCPEARSRERLTEIPGSDTPADMLRSRFLSGERKPRQQVQQGEADEQAALARQYRSNRLLPGLAPEIGGQRQQQREAGGEESH